MLAPAIAMLRMDAVPSALVIGREVILLCCAMVLNPYFCLIDSIVGLSDASLLTCFFCVYPFLLCITSGCYPCGQFMSGQLKPVGVLVDRPPLAGANRNPIKAVMGK